MKTKQKTLTLIIYVVIFYAVWTAFEFLCKPFINEHIDNAVISQILKSAVIKNLVWTVPAILLVRHFASEVHIGLKEMFRPKTNWLSALPIFAAFTVFILANSYMVRRTLAISDKFDPTILIAYLFVGLTEEMVFRGWLLNATYREDKKWLVIGINALMFMMIHFPKWIHQGMFIFTFTSFSFIVILVLSVIFSLTFLKNRNILIPIALHMYWDVLTELFN